MPTVEIDLPERAITVISWLDDSFGETFEEKVLAFLQFGLTNIPNRCFTPPPEAMEGVEGEAEEGGEELLEVAEEQVGQRTVMDPLADGIEWLFGGDHVVGKAKLEATVGPWDVRVSSDAEGVATVVMEPSDLPKFADGEGDKALRALRKAIGNSGTDARISQVNGGDDYEFLAVSFQRKATPAFVAPSGWHMTEVDK